MTSGPDKAANLETAGRLVARAAATGADLVALPEKWNAIGTTEQLHAAAEPLEGGESVEAMAGWARTLGITLVGGSISEQREGREKLSNTSLAFGPEGELLGLYRKIHLFDVEVGGVVYRESEAEEAGAEAVVVQTEGWPIGLTVCYDVRFPELYRILALEGAELVTVPAHFTTPTGKDHWHVLLRARAIENQYFVAAPAQVGETLPGKPAYGRSLIVDPWGIVLAQAPDEETVITATLDRALLRSVRDKLPSLKNRQAGADRWPASVCSRAGARAAPQRQALRSRPRRRAVSQHPRRRRLPPPAGRLLRRGALPAGERSGGGVAPAAAARGTTANGEQAVLKVQLPHRESEHE